MGRRVIWIFLGLLVLAAPPSRAAAPETATMAVPAFSLSFSLGYLAEDLGLFAAEGVAVKQVEIQGLGAINAVISGSTEFAEPSAASLTRAAARGQKLLGIAALTDHPFVQLVMRKDVAAAAGFAADAPLGKRALTLKGRTIAADSVNSVVHAYVRLVAQAGGYDPEQVRMAFMAPTSMVAALETKQIDGYAMTPPWPEVALLQGSGVLIASGPDGDPALTPFVNTVLLAKPETCDKRPTLCEKVGRAFAAAARAIHDKPDAALAALEKRFSKLDPAQMKASFALLRKITPSPPVITAAALENVDNYNVRAGLLKPEEKLKSYDGLFTDRYVAPH